MTFCIKCGKEISEGADFCTYCGTQVSSTKESVSDYSGIGGILILIGGILAIIFSFFSILGSIFLSYWGGMMRGWTGMPRMMERWGIPMAFGSWIFGIMVIGAIVSIILGILDLWPVYL